MKRRQKWDMRGKITINKASFHSHMKLTLNNSYPDSSPEPGYEANMENCSNSSNKTKCCQVSVPQAADS